jgi:hypothetical protein
MLLCKWVEANYGPSVVELGRGCQQITTLDEQNKRRVVRQVYDRDNTMLSEQTLGYIPPHLLIEPVQTYFHSEGGGLTGCAYVMTEAEKQMLEGYRNEVFDALASYQALIQLYENDGA